MQTQNIHVLRYEKKFILTQEQAIRIQKKLDKVMQRDPASQLGPYRVRSLYFDSIDSNDYYDKLSGVEKRKKIRLRYYNTQHNKVKLELKEKIGEEQLKTALLMTRDDAKMFIDGDYKVLLQYENSLAHRLYIVMQLGIYRPTLLIDYERVAYMHEENNTRITFDSALRSDEVHIDFFSEQGAQIPVIAPYEVVLEVKYSGYCFAWLQEILESEDLWQNAMSKYCSGRQFFETYIDRH